MAPKNTSSAVVREPGVGPQDQLGREISYLTGCLMEMEHSGVCGDNTLYSSYESQLRRRLRELHNRS